MAPAACPWFVAGVSVVACSSFATGTCGGVLATTSNWLHAQAPEILTNGTCKKGNGNPYDVNAEIYSVNIVVWQCVTARLPYAEHSISNFKLESQIVKGLRPSCGEMVNGDGGVVCGMVSVTIEAGWGNEPLSHPRLEMLLDILRSRIESLEERHVEFTNSENELERVPT